MSQTININCPFAYYQECTIRHGGDSQCIKVVDWDDSTDEYKVNHDEYCEVQDCLVTWIDERIGKSKCAICQPCIEEEE